MPGLPGGKLAGRPLHFIWIADCSYSMAGEKIKSLNEAIRESLPHMQKVAEDNPNAEVLIRAIKFSSGAEWHIGMPTAIDQFQWDDLSVESSTDLGAALSLLADALKIPPMDTRALPPVLVLLSDGMPTDDYKAGLNKLMAEPWGKRSVRNANAIGSDADLDVLKKFIANPELEPLVAKNSPQLVKAIRWASTAVLQAASAPASQGVGKDRGQGALPPPPPAGPAAAEHDDVW